MDLISKQTVDELKKLLAELPFSESELFGILIGVLVVILVASYLHSRKRKKDPYAWANLLQTFEKSWEIKFDSKKEWINLKMVNSIAHFMKPEGDNFPIKFTKDEYDENELTIWRKFISNLPDRKRKQKLLKEFHSEKVSPQQSS